MCMSKVVTLILAPKVIDFMVDQSAKRVLAIIKKAFVSY